jgi:hypothetical protein
LTAVVTVSGDGNSGFPVQVANVIGPPTVTANYTSYPNNLSTLTITGTGFSPTASNDSVSFNLNAFGSVTSASATSLTVTFTTEPTGSGELNAVVSVTGGGQSSSAPVANLTAPGVNTNTSSLPINATSITINGFFGYSGSTSTDSVAFNLGAVGTVTTANPFEVVVNFTTDPTSAGSLTAVVTVGGEGVSAPTQVATVVPAITASTAGLLEYDTTLTIAGAGFDTSKANDSVSFTNGGVTGSVIGATSTDLTVSVTGLTGVGNNTALTASVTVDGASTSAQTVATVQSSFGVDSVTSTPSGLVLLFNAPIDPNTTVLYTTPGDTTYGAADVTFVGNSVGNVRGSLILDASNPDEATFVETSGLLQADTYTLTVSSAVKALGGYTLSGNYTATVTVAATTTPVVSAPSFARGPGQSVVLPGSTGLPISISGASGVTQVSFSLTYDPTLLYRATPSSMWMHITVSSRRP